MTTERANRFPMPAWIAVLLIAMLFTTRTAWADNLTFTVVTEPEEAGNGGSYEMRKLSNNEYSDRQFIVIPEEGFAVKDVTWSDNGIPPMTLTAEGTMTETYYTAGMPSGEVVITFTMKTNGKCGKAKSDRVYWAFNDDKKLLYISYISGNSEMEDYEDNDNKRAPWWQYHETISTLIVGNGVTAIGNNAFNHCSSLTTVNVYAATPPELGSNVFDDNASDRKIYVPYASLDDYKSASGWSNYKDNIEPMGAKPPYALIVEPNYEGGTSAGISVSYDMSLTDNNYHYTLDAADLEAQFNRSGDHTIVGWATSPAGDVVYAPNATIVLTENPTTIYAVWDDTENWIVTKSEGSSVYDVLTIKKNTAMADYDHVKYTPWWPYHETIKTIVVNEGVTTIGKNAFGGFEALTSVSLPHSLTSIGHKAFQNCSGLTPLKIPSGVTVIKYEAFGGCDGLTSIDIPASVTSIEDYAFSNCSSLKTVNVYAATPPTLGSNVFDDNASGRKIYVPSAALKSYKDAGGWSNYKGDILPVDIPYIDADGNTSYRYDFTALDGSETTLTNNVDTNNDGTLDQGWYVVNSDISYTNTITLDGDIHLILCDGKTMSVNTGDSEYSFDGFTLKNGNNLTIYGQANQTGRLEAYSKGDDTIYLEFGNYTQYGGDVYLSNTNNNEGWALVASYLYTGGDVTISRGKLTASISGKNGTAISAGKDVNILGGQCDAQGETAIAAGYDVNILGGQLDAQGETAIAAGNNVNILGGQLDAQGGTEGEYAYGIYAWGNITLGWTTATDRIKASSYYSEKGTVKIADGQTLYDEDGVAHTSSNLGSIDGKTLRGVLDQRGDANGDGSITVTDIAVVVNCILQLANNGGYSPYGADANGDGDITVTDIGVIVDKILGTSNNSGNAGARRMTHDAVEPQ